MWEEGETRLLDYGGEGPAVLFVPSLINRAYILDLMEDGSMLRWLSAHGVHPYLLDWGWPGEAERTFSLTDYIAGRLERAIAALPGKIVLAGYCMGGLLALAAALRLPEKVSALALLATPWDFHADDPAAAKRLSDMLPALEPMMGFSNTLPIDALNALFAMVDPYGVGDKYRDFAAQDKSSARARRFVAMEDWLADGVPLAAPVAREALGGWYGANSPARLQWRVAGLAVDPARLTVPAFCAMPARDRLVPAASAQKLAGVPAAGQHHRAPGRTYRHGRRHPCQIRIVGAIYGLAAPAMMPANHRTHREENRHGRYRHRLRRAYCRWQFQRCLSLRPRPMCSAPRR